MKEFTEIYEEVYKESGEELKKIKSANTWKNAILVLILIGIAVISVVADASYLWFVFAIVFVIFIVMISMQSSKYKMQYKDKVIRNFVKGYSEKLEYQPERGISSSIYDEAKFDGFYDRYHSEDLIEGTILDDCKITMAEVHTEREERTTDSDGHTTTTYVTLFQGLFAKIDLSKSSNLDFRIIKNALLFKGKNRLEMDSGEFEKIFDVKTTDKIATLRVLTSDIMQMLIDFKNENKIVPEIVLYHNNLYIRFAVGNVFEPNLIRNDMDFDKLKKNYDMINFIFNLTKDFSKNILEFDE